MNEEREASLLADYIDLLDREGTSSERVRAMEAEAPPRLRRLMETARLVREVYTSLAD
jgi:hypothetical protein